MVVVGKMKLLFLAVVAGLALTLGFNLDSSSAHDSSSTTDFNITAVKVTDAKTVHVTFSNALKENQAALQISNGQNNHFFGEHLDASIPHIHAVSNIALSQDKKTVTLTLSRDLHKDKEIKLAVLNVEDEKGNKLSSAKWEVWDSGSEN